MNTIRVLVVDGHAVVRAGLRAILATQLGVQVVGEAADGPTALSLAAELNPDLVVIEVSLAEMSGAELATLLCSRGHKVLALTACEDSGVSRMMLAAGATGCVLKRSPVEELVRAVRAVANGAVYLDPAVAHADGNGTETTGAELSGREAEVVRFIALGYSNKEIAARLRVSVKTIETYKTRSMEKLALKSRVDIVRYAVGRGWLTGLDVAHPSADGDGKHVSPPDGSSHLIASAAE